MTKSKGEYSYVSTIIKGLAITTAIRVGIGIALSNVTAIYDLYTYIKYDEHDEEEEEEEEEDSTEFVSLCDSPSSYAL